MQASQRLAKVEKERNYHFTLAWLATFSASPPPVSEIEAGQSKKKKNRFTGGVMTMRQEVLYSISKVCNLNPKFTCNVQHRAGDLAIHFS